MGLRRSTVLSLVAVSLSLQSLYCAPGRAEEGELAAQDIKAQINLRSLANTQADIVAAGKVGDRVQLLNHSSGDDGLVWYRVKVLRSGELGWVRGDLIKIFGAPKATATVPKTEVLSKSTSKPKAATSAKPSAAPIPLTPPKVPQAHPATSTATAAPLPKASGGEIKAADSPKPLVPATPANAVIVSFQTPTYAVRVFSEAGHLHLNLFNRKSKQLALESVPVESKNSKEGTIYLYSNDLKVTVIVPTKGVPTLTTTALGTTLQEQPEAAPVPQ